LIIETDDGNTLNTHHAPFKGTEVRFILLPKKNGQYRILDRRTGNIVGTCEGARKEALRFLRCFVSTD
jgi:hypothetical protein